MSMFSNFRRIWRYSLTTFDVACEMLDNTDWDCMLLTPLGKLEITILTNYAYLNPSNFPEGPQHTISHLSSPGVLFCGVDLSTVNIQDWINKSDGTLYYN